MDVAAGDGLPGGFGSVLTPITIDGGDFGASCDKHARVAIFGATTATTGR